MPRPIDELAAPGSATCRATAGLIAADAVRGGRAFHFNLWRRGFVMRMTDAAANSGGLRITTLAASGVIGILIGMTLVLYALPGLQTGVIATLSATSPVIILPLRRLRTGQGPTARRWAGASTAGGQALRGKRRHPTIEDRVTIYPGATILGGDTIIGAGSTIGGNVFVMDSVQPNSLVIYDGLDMRVLSKSDKNTSLDFQI